MLGTALGNYSGINAVQLNPSSMHNSKSWLDIHLVSGDFFLQNNYLYLSKSEFIIWDIFKPGFTLPTHDEDYGTEVRSFYRYDNTRGKDAFINLRINGPGAMLIWRDHAFGLHTAVRSVTSLHNIPYDLANFLYLGLNYKLQQNINYTSDKRFFVSQMSWLEVGLSYAYKVYARGFNRIDAGISVKRLFGLTGAYIVSDEVDYLVLDDSTLQVNNLRAEYGFSLPIDYNSNSIATVTDPLFSGGGWGFDFGATFTRLKKPHQKQYFDKLCGQQYEDYLYRIGIALIDIGGITFKDRAQKHAIDNQSSYWEDLNSFEFQTVNQLMDTISYQFYGDPAASYQDDRFTMWLPSALSVQFDYHHYRNWYVNSSLILPFQMSRASLARPAQVAITPRYESYWFEANLPISLYDWYQLRMGLSLRFYFLTIGTEKLGTYFGLSNFNGMDVYFSIKVPLRKGSCRSKVSKACPAYENYRKLKL